MTVGKYMEWRSKTVYRLPSAPSDDEIRQEFGFALADCPQQKLAVDKGYPWSFYQHIYIASPQQGCELKLCSLTQQDTYLDTLCGLPTADFYQLDQARQTAARLHPDHKARSIFLPPEIIAGSFKRASADEVQETEWQGLPGVLSIGEFQFPAPKSAPYSICSVVIAWWQKDFGPPDERAIKQISGLDLDPFVHGWDP